VHRLLERVELPAGRWLEPCAGRGAIVRAVNAVRHDVEWSAYEPRKECLRALLDAGVGDVRQQPLPRSIKGELFDVAFTNPPYSTAYATLEVLLCSAHWVVALLRLNFIASEERAPLMRAARPSVYVLPNRPSFDGDGTDATDYAWFVFGPEKVGTVEVLDSTSLSVRRMEARPPDRAQTILPLEVP
jgi:hypothetical protein